MIFKCPFCYASVDRTHQDCPSCRQRMVRLCPACSEEISIRATICKYCGEAVERPPMEIIPAAKPAAVPVPEIEFIDEAAPRVAPPETIAWENPKRGFLSRWWGTVRESNFNTRDFYSKMPQTGGYSKPIGFAYGLFLQFVMIAVILVSLGGLGAVLSGAQVRQQHTLVGLAVLLGVVGGGYVAIAGSLFVSSLFWHVVAKVFGGKGSYESTFRIIGYSTSASIWALIPYIGGVVVAVMHAIQLYHGFREVHGLSQGRALAAVFFPTLLGLALILVFAGCLFAACACCH